MHPLLVVVLTLVGVVVLFLLLLVATGGSLGRMGLACQAFFKTLRDAEFAGRVDLLLHPPPPEPPKPVKPSGAPLRMLVVLQRESRLVDFLMEDIQHATDDQVAAAVRDIQPRAQASLKKHLTLAPVLPEPEGSTVEVAAGFDPSAIQLVGNVTGQPPFRGVVRHAGWRVTELSLAPPPEGTDELVLAPAEVELP